MQKRLCNKVPQCPKLRQTLWEPVALDLKADQANRRNSQRAQNQTIKFANQHLFSRPSQIRRTRWTARTKSLVEGSTASMRYTMRCPSSSSQPISKTRVATDPTMPSTTQQLYSSRKPSGRTSPLRWVSTGSSRSTILRKYSSSSSANSTKYSSPMLSYAKSYLTWTGWAGLKNCTLASLRKHWISICPFSLTMASKLQ